MPAFVLLSKNIISSLNSANFILHQNKVLAMVIDSHVHFWKYDKKRDTWMKDMKVLQQDYLPATLAATFKRNEIDGCVAVQADQSELETHFL